MTQTGPTPGCPRCEKPKSHKIHIRTCPKSRFYESPAGEESRQEEEEEELEPEVPNPPEPVLTPESGGKEPTLPSLTRLHNRLNKELELYKLHIKHYHMNLNQFRKRTSQLALPDEIYEKYKKVCQGCSVCNRMKPAPSRSKISGIRAENFGDVIFENSIPKD